MKLKIFFSALLLLALIPSFSQKHISSATTPNEKLNKAYCTGLSKTNEASYFDLLSDNAAATVGGYFNILDWLQGRVAGLQLYYSVNNDRIPFIRNGRSAIYVDEILVNPSYLNSLPATDIAMIKIIKTPSAGFGASSVIAIYTGPIEEEDEE